MQSKMPKLDDAKMMMSQRHPIKKPINCNTKNGSRKDKQSKKTTNKRGPQLNIQEKPIIPFLAELLIHPCHLQYNRNETGKTQIRNHQFRHEYGSGEDEEPKKTYKQSKDTNE